MTSTSVQGLRPASCSLVDVGKTRGSRSARLALLANQQMSAEAAYFRSTNQAIPTTLASIYVTPSPVTIAVGQSQKVTLSGTLNSGATAPDHLLAGAVWSSSSPSIVEVSGGIVAGLAGGTATVSAQVGSHIATLQVTVVVISTSPRLVRNQQTHQHPDLNLVVPDLKAPRLKAVGVHKQRIRQRIK